MAAYVLDSYALLAFLRNEPGCDFVSDLLHAADKGRHSLYMTEVNYAEVKYMLIRKHGEKAWRAHLEAFARLPIRYFSLTRELADIAAEFKAAHALSLADACAASLARFMSCPVVTGDPEFKSIASEVIIHWI